VKRLFGIRVETTRVQILIAVSGLLLAACSGGRTELLIEVTSDLTVPDVMDRIVVMANGPNGQTQNSVADLGPGRIPLPRVLGMEHQGGPLGPFTVDVIGEKMGTEVVRRTLSVSFVKNRTMVLHVELLGECQGVTCPTDQTCARGGCRSVDVHPSELEPYDGTPPPLDASAFDSCVPDERCNGIDDDCDGQTDEGFDLQTDPQNCGSCGHSCDVPNATAACMRGACVIGSCDSNFADCDANADTGCEANLQSDANTCGSCTNRCSPPDRACCAGSCARSAC